MVLFPQFHDDIQKVHRVQTEQIAQRRLIRIRRPASQFASIRIGSDFGNDVQHDLAHVRRRLFVYIVHVLSIVIKN